MLNISMTTLHEAASALGLSYDAWARSHRPEVQASLHSTTCVLQAVHVQTSKVILTDYVCLQPPCFVGVAAAWRRPIFGQGSGCAESLCFEFGRPRGREILECTPILTRSCKNVCFVNGIVSHLQSSHNTAATLPQSSRYGVCLHMCLYPLPAGMAGSQRDVSPDLAGPDSFLCSMSPLILQGKVCKHEGHAALQNMLQAWVLCLVAGPGEGRTGDLGSSLA